jgi:hypothetical protein
MRIAFIVSAYRTVLFHAVGRRLEEAGHEVFWLSPNRRWARWLVAQGVLADRVFDLTEHASEWRGTAALTPEDIAELRDLERACGWNVNDVILMCDLLKRRPRDYALRYLAVAARRVRGFLTRRAIDFVSGEQTWAFELVAGQVCDQLGVTFLRPFYLRIPEDRFVFFLGRTEEHVLTIRPANDEDRASGRRLLKEFREGRQFAYMSFDSLIAARPQWKRVKIILKHLLDLWHDPFDETSLHPIPLVGKHLAMILRDRRNRRLGVFEPATLPPRRPFIFLTLHLEPEMTIDVLGNPLNNQVELVRALARRLPVTHDLWVKEHRIALSKRRRQFYDELARIPGVRLVDPFARSLEVMRHAELVLAITGTATYEAALLGIPSATMAPTIFGPVLAAAHFNPFVDSLDELLEGVRGSPTKTDEALIEYLAWAHAQSWPGYVTDTFWDPDCMAADNVANVAEAFSVAMTLGTKTRAEAGRVATAARCPS